MSTTIIMPQLGESVAEGVIGKWLKGVGDPVAKDEPIVEVITDKVNAEIPSPVAGVLEKITQEEGATVAVGQEIAVIGGGEGGEGQAGQSSAAQSASGNGQSVGNGSSAGGTASASQPATEASPAPVALAEARSDKGRAERVRTSPLVKRLAEQYGINLAEVPGTGIGGRVSKQDILSFIEQKDRAPQEAPHLAPTGAFERPAAQVTSAPPAPAPSPVPQPARQPGANEELVPVSPLRKMIAEHMVRSTSTIPHATTMSDVDMTRVVRFREAHNRDFRQREGVPISYVAFVIKATVEALKQFPYVNAEWAGDNIILKKDININVAVDAPEGLTTPVIHHADSMSLAGLSRAIYDLATRARDKKLKVEDMQGGTFTVNNTGALGSDSGVSIINYPQAGILSAGTIVKKPVVMEVDGEDLIAVRNIMNLSFSFDHRILDGGGATSFVNAVKQTLESWHSDYPVY
jgi:2-oxoglutarate dehydrogenase dihydrolipoamide succinyltransferase (E2 component)